jgi:hypothetical protein
MSSAHAGVVLESLPQLSGKPWREGGEAFIFEHPTEKNQLIKVFHKNQIRTPRTGPGAAHLVDLYSLSEGLSPSQSRRLSDCFSWPITLYGTSIDKIDGIAIRRADENFWLEYTNTFETIYTVQNLAFLGPALSKPIIVSAPYTSVSFENRIEIAMEFLRALSVLWQLGFRYCDYSENNLLWAFEPRPCVFVIDAEGCSRPGTKENRSPGWMPLDDQLGFSIESDRSQCALVVWRVICGDMKFSPPNSQIDSPARNLQKSTIRLIAKLRHEGTAELAAELLEDLKQYRGSVISDAAFEWAVSTQYADVVLDYAPEKPSRYQQEIIDRALDQRRLENDIRSSAPAVRRAKLSRSVPIAGFEFDISLNQSSAEIQHEPELLRELALEGEFAQIAEVFATSKDSMEINNVVTRSIQSALSIFGAPKIHAVRAQSGHQRFEWAWPGAPFVNCAKVDIIGPNSDLLNTTIAYRKTSKSGLTLPIDSAYPENSVLQISLGLVTPNNQFVFCPLTGEAPVATSHRPMNSVHQSTGTAAPIGPELTDRTWTPVEARESARGESKDTETEDEDVLDLFPPTQIGERPRFFGRLASSIRGFTRRRV